jgi:hypothetical protein
MKLPRITILLLCVFAIPQLCLSSPDTAAQEATANILPEGSFETKTGTFFAGWKPGGFLGGSPAWNNSVTAETEKKGEPFVRLRVSDPKGSSVGISQTEKLVLNPAWKSIALKVSVRLADFKKASDWGGRCQFSIKFADENDKPLPDAPHLGLSKNTTGWEELSKEFIIPPGAASMAAEIQLTGATGILDVRNLRAIPTPP